MSFTKFAAYEDVEILEVKGTESRARTASLDKVAEFSDYRTGDGYLYVRCRAISSRTNKNHDGWPSVELAGGEDNWNKHAKTKEAGTGFVIEANKKDEYGFSTFVGKPIFVDHHNSNTDRARGVIVDSKLYVQDQKTASELDPYYASSHADPHHLPPTHVELLLEVDAKSFPKLAKAIVTGSKDPDKGIDGFSMGCDVEYSKCSHCDNIATQPSEYCNHIKAKGAEHDFTSSAGAKTSRKSYENCYGIRFFEISAVFDPADETALTQEIIDEDDHKKGSFLGSKQAFGPVEIAELAGTGVAGLSATPLGDKVMDRVQEFKNRNVKDGYCHSRNCQGHIPLKPDGSCPACGTVTASTKQADNPLPQSELIKAPEDVDTLREEKVCPICGADMENGKCDVCGYDEPPEDMQNPDLSKAKENDDQKRDTEQTQVPADGIVPPAANGEGTSFLQARKPRPTAKVRSSMRWTPKTIIASSTDGDEPNEAVISDQTVPVTSSYRTAQALIEAAKHNQGASMTHRVAAEPADAMGKADKRVNVDEIGGFDQATNENASKADAQVDVEGKGGVGVSDVSADSHETLDTAGKDTDDSGFNKDKTTDDSGPTKTFPNKNQQSPVTNDTFPNSAEGVKKSHDDSAFPAEDGGLAGGKANQGTQPVDPVGKAQDRVNVLDHVTSPSNNSGATDTWSGTNGNGVTKQQDPVTRDLQGFNTENGWKNSSTHLFAALKQADKEIELGITASGDKYNRIQALTEMSPESLKATAAITAKVASSAPARTSATQRTAATRVPSFHRITSDEARTASTTQDDTDGDTGLFL